MSETGWRVQISLKAPADSLWIAEPPDGVVDVLRAEMEQLGVARQLVMRSPDGSEGVVILDLQPETHVPNTSEDILVSVTTRAVNSLKVHQVVASQAQLDAGVTVQWQGESGL